MAFSSALFEFTGTDAGKPSDGAKQVPSPGFSDLTYGGPVAGDWEVLRRFGGDVEWEAVFEGIEKGSAERPEKLKFKIDGLLPTIHAYPEPSSAEKWKQVAAGTSIRFHGTIEGNYRDGDHWQDHCLPAQSAIRVQLLPGKLANFAKHVQDPLGLTCGQREPGSQKHWIVNVQADPFHAGFRFFR